MNIRAKQTKNNKGGGLQSNTKDKDTETNNNDDNN